MLGRGCDPGKGANVYDIQWAAGSLRLEHEKRQRQRICSWGHLCNHNPNNSNHLLIAYYVPGSYYKINKTRPRIEFIKNQIRSQ